MNMIIIWVAGGLGNQLFFINKALELKPNSRFVFLDTKFYKNDIRYGRKFHFKEQMKIIPIFNRKLIYILFRINKILNKLNLFHFYKENEFEMKLIKPFQIIYLTGYWQEGFKPEKNNLQKINHLFKQIKLKEDHIVAVHFRSEEYDIKLPIDYYLNALEEFDKEINEFHLYGDSNEYLNKMSKEIFKDTSHKIINLEKDLDEFVELKSYKNFISSNSTFCWWAVILNQDNTLRVVSPQKWNIGYDEEYNIFRPNDWKLI